MIGFWICDLFVLQLLVTVNSKVKVDSNFHLSYCKTACLHKCWKICADLRKSINACQQTDCVEVCQDDCLLNELQGHRPAEVMPAHRPSAGPTHRGEDPLAQAHALVHALGLEEDLGLARATKSRPLHDKATVLGSTVKNVTLAAPWRVREMNFVYHSDVTSVEIHWGPPPQLENPSFPLMYFVTWEMKGGVLRGNLLTNSSSASLSLWPDTEYRIQVSLFSLEGPQLQSEFLVVNTHRQPHPHQHVKVHEPPGNISQLVAAAAALLLVASLAFTWRWRHRLYLPHAKLVDEHINSTLHRVFPPVIGLATSSMYTNELNHSSEHLTELRTLK